MSAESDVMDGTNCQVCDNHIGNPVGYPRNCGCAGLPESKLKGVNMIRKGYEAGKLDHCGEIWIEEVKVGYWVFDITQGKYVGDVYGKTFKALNTDELRKLIQTDYMELLV